MDSFKKSKYVVVEEVQDKIFLYYSSLSNEFMLLNSTKSSTIQNNSADEIESKDPELFNILLDKKFILEEDFNETGTITRKRRESIESKDWYQIVVNTTLDCNLNCWYCYENKVKGSRLTREAIEAICSNILAQFSHSPYKALKLSFFGGEPFMYWKGMREIIEFADSFCKDNNVTLILDFTTNATLMNERIIDYLSKYQCHFQITLDGSEVTHNLVKKPLSGNSNSYRKTLSALKLITEKINKHLIALRINFDNRALNEIDSIINDISFLNRKRSYVIVKKVWQIDTEDVDKGSLLQVLQKLFDNRFLPDYYIMPKGDVCFAERENQVLFNYDGNIFKCTTICSFDKDNSLGELNTDTGLVRWNEPILSEWLGDMQQQQCLECKWYGACFGPCNRQLMANRDTFICTFDSMNLDTKEYLMYLFKYNLLMNELYS